MGDIWCRHYSYRPRYCRNNSVYKKFPVDLIIVDLSNEGVITLELINVDNNNQLTLDLNL